MPNEVIQTQRKYTIITAIAMIATGVVLHITGIAYSLTTPWAIYTQYVFLFIGLMLNAIAFNKLKNGEAMFGQIFTSSFKVCALALLITVIWAVLSIKFIFPDTEDQVMEFLKQNALDKGLSEKTVEERFEPTRKYFMLFSIGGQIFYTLFLGAIFSLISAAVAKKVVKQ